MKNELITYRKITTVDQRSIPRRVKPHLCGDGGVNVHRYEWYLYQRLNQALADGKVYVVESEKNKQLKDDLISRKDWKSSRSRRLKHCVPPMRAPAPSII